MKTLNELTVGTKIGALTYTQMGTPFTTSNLTVVSNEDETLELKAQDHSIFLLPYDRILEYRENEKIVTVGYKQSEEAEEVVYTNWVIDDETYDCLIITKKDKYEKIRKVLEKRHITEIKEMN